MYTLARPLRRALATNSNSSSLTAKASTTTLPSNDGVLVLRPDSAGVVPQKVMVWPIGNGGKSNAFSMRVIGWEQAIAANAAALWVPSILAEVSATLGNAVGVFNAAVSNAERFADTITIVSARQSLFTDVSNTQSFQEGTVEIISPANDTQAWFVVNTYGLSRLEFQFNQTTGTPTMNALVAPVEEISR
jgi:hypothetical protein